MNDHRERRRPVSLRDVAAAAGVSAATASRALNNTGQMRAATRATVIDAARELGFRPNLLTQGVLGQRSFSVGLLATDGIGRFTLPVLLGAEDFFDAGSVSVFLCDTQGDKERERHYIDVLLGRRVDGIIVAGISEGTREPIDDLEVPVVYALTPSSRASDMSVVLDDLGSGRVAAAHLFDLGRRSLGFIGGPKESAAVQDRSTGFVAEAERLGAHIAGGPRFGSWEERWGRECATSLLAEHPEIDGIHCASDLLARGAADALREAGVVIPTEVALSGTDNWDVMIAGARPALTSVDLRLKEVGTRSATLLLDMVGGRSRSGQEIVECMLVARESTGPRP